MRCANKFPSHEINAEDDLKTTILNLPKQIRELQQERSSTSFQHHRFYSNSDPLRLKMTYRGVTTGTRREQNPQKDRRILRKTKTTQIFVLLLKILLYLHIFIR